MNTDNDDKKDDFSQQCKGYSWGLGPVLQRARDNAHLTQSEMAARIDASRAYISKVECGNCAKVPAYVVYRYCQVLAVQPEAILNTGIKAVDELSPSQREMIKLLSSMPEDKQDLLLSIAREFSSVR